MEERVGGLVIFFSGVIARMRHNGSILNIFTLTDERKIRVYLFAQTTSNATEAIITQMVQSRLKPVRRARDNEGREHSRRRKKRIPGGEG